MDGARSYLPTEFPNPVFPSVSYRSDCSNRDQFALIRAVLAVHLGVTVQRLGTLVSPKVHLQLLTLHAVPTGTKLTLHARVYDHFVAWRCKRPSSHLSTSSLANRQACLNPRCSTLRTAFKCPARISFLTVSRGSPVAFTSSDMRYQDLIFTVSP